MNNIQELNSTNKILLTKLKSLEYKVKRKDLQISKLNDKINKSISSGKHKKELNLELAKLKKHEKDLHILEELLDKKNSSIDIKSKKLELKIKESIKRTKILDKVIKRYTDEKIGFEREKSTISSEKVQMTSLLKSLSKKESKIKNLEKQIQSKLNLIKQKEEKVKRINEKLRSKENDFTKIKEKLAHSQFVLDNKEINFTESKNKFRNDKIKLDDRHAKILNEDLELSKKIQDHITIKHKISQRLEDVTDKEKSLKTRRKRLDLLEDSLKRREIIFLDDKHKLQDNFKELDNKQKELDSFDLS